MGDVIDITSRIRRAAPSTAADLAALLPLPAEAPARFVPAYCDPSNEQRGEKYERGLTTTEIAARVRADIKAALKAGALPAGTKVSVRSSSYSGGSSLIVTVTAVPAGMTVRNPDRVLREAAEPHVYLDHVAVPHYTPEASALLETITGLAMAYRRDNSDTSVDYFDCNFYGGHASFSYDVDRASREAILAARRAS